MVDPDPFGKDPPEKAIKSNCQNRKFINNDPENMIPELGSHVIKTV